MFLFQQPKPRERSIVVSTNALYVQPDEENSAAVRELEAQRLKWEKFLKNRPTIWSQDWLWVNRLAPTDDGPIKKKFMQIFNSKTKLRKQVKALIRAGVPPELRGQVWYACSGAEAKRTKASRDEQYPNLLKRTHELDGSLIAIDIEKDLLRTFPEKISPDDKLLVDQLRRMLRAYALRNKAVGYCQSMNYVCALLLFHLEEERAFWTFAALLEDILPSDYYVPTLIGGRIDQQVFQSCIAWKLPKVYEVFRSTNTVLEPVICPWFMCLYVNVLPLYAVCRVWDCLFWEGSNVLFRIGLTLVKSKSNEILQASDFIGVYSVLKGNSLKPHSFELEINPENQVDADSVDRPFMSDAEFLIQSAFGFRWLRSVPKEKVEVLRDKFSQLLKEEEEKRAAKDAAESQIVSSKPVQSDHSPDREITRRRRRQSELMSRLLDEKNIHNLRELALQMDEGLTSHVEEFARQLETAPSEAEIDELDYEAEADADAFDGEEIGEDEVEESGKCEGDTDGASTS